MQKIMLATDAEQRLLYSHMHHAHCVTPRQTPPTSRPPKFQSPHTHAHTGSWEYGDTSMDTQLLDCLFEIDSQQQDWGEEGYEENGEDICQGPTIATTGTRHAAGEVMIHFF